MSTMMSSSAPEIVIFDAALIEEREYWTNRLSGLNVSSYLSPDHERPQAYLPETGLFEASLPESLSQQLNKLTGGSPFLLYTVLVTAVKICLQKYSGSRMIVVGSPALKDASAVAAPQQSNLLVIADEIDEQQSFKQLLLRVRETLLEATKRQAYPFQRLIKDLGLDGVVNRCPLCDVLVRLDEIHGERPEARHDIIISFSARGGKVAGQIEFRSGLYEQKSIERFWQHLSEILKNALAETATPIARLGMLTEAERRQLLIEWNSTSRDYDSKTCFQHLFEQQVERTPGGIAVIADGEQLTYAELNQRANQLAHHLRKLDVGPEVRVGILTRRSTEMLVGVLGIMKAGGAYVPLDAEYPQERLAFMLADAQVPVLLTQESLMIRLPENAPPVICLDADWPTIAAEATDNPAIEVKAENLAYVIYTSGSTGKPKGVMIQHQGLVNYLNWCAEAYRVREGEGAVVHSSLAFDLTITGLFSPLMAGRSVRFISDDDEIEGLSTALSRTGNLSLVKITPSHLDLLGQLLPPEAAAGKANALIIGGEALRGESLSFWRTHAPQTRLINEYGPTETVVGCCVFEVPEGKESHGPVPIGRPIANTELYVLDHNLQPVPVGVSGELYIGGDGVARGYLNRPDVTAEKFIPHPFTSRAGVRLYRTGDAVRYMANGNLEFLGRLDQQVKIRGFRIELGEIEAALGQHPAVREVLVEAREVAPGDRRLIAYMVMHQEQEAQTAELRSYLRTRLPEYMLPSSFLRLDEMPLTANGKVDRRALPEPGQVAPGANLKFVEPRTPVEEVLAGIWSEVLRQERVSIEDNFFEAGGHSLLATQVVSRIREAFHLELPLRSLFEQPTVAALASTIEQLLKSEQGLAAPPITAVSREQPLPLSFAQQRLWFLDQLQPGSVAYNLPAALRLKGRLEMSALERSLNEVVRRHEILRTTLALAGQQPVQVINEPRPVKIPFIDLSALSEAEREDETRALAIAEARRPFDLSQGPLVRATVLKLAESEHVLLWTMHHIVSDGWSVGVLLKELAALYEAYLAGEPSPLPELSIQYADYAHWQRNWLQGEVLKAHLDYWKKQLAGAPPILELPTDMPRPAVQSFRGAHETLLLSTELTARLNALSQKTGATLFMTLLAAWQVLLHYYTGADEIVVGTPIANRNRAETEALIGFFVNALPLRTSLKGNPEFSELLKRVREVCLGAYTHQDVPFETIVEEVQPERVLSHAPLFQVWFVGQNNPMPSLSLSELSISPLPFESETVHLDLVMNVNTAGERGLLLTLQYNTDIFNGPTIARHLQHFQLLLQSITAGSELELNQLMEKLRQAEETERQQREKRLTDIRREKFANLKRRTLNSRTNEAV